MNTPRYMSGFGNRFATEAIPGTLPEGRNSPQKVAHGLYAEQISGSGFMAPRVANLSTWVYRIGPGVLHTSPYRAIDPGFIRTAPMARYESSLPIGQRSWNAPPLPAEPTTFVAGLRTVTTAGDAEVQTGLAVHLAFVTASMTDEYFVNVDGELLVVMQQGRLRFRTELGIIDVAPREICVIPRGITFKVELLDGPARAYVCENYGRPFILPDLGPVGANGMANPRDFLTPVAAFEDKAGACTMIVKSGGGLYACDLTHSPLDIVAWHGNYAPYKYDLRHFCPIGTVLFDHADPSLFAVLSSPSDMPGYSNVDFLNMGEFWLVAEDTYRPPYFHRNFASEFMGVLSTDPTFRPQGFDGGGFQVHNQMLPHGVDAQLHDAASNLPQEPVKIDLGQFMFETRFQQRLTKYAESLAENSDYLDRWRSLERGFAVEEPSA